MNDKPLPKKYLKALALIEAGDMSYADVAKASGIPPDTFYDLIEGRCEDYGTIGTKFTEQLSIIFKRVDKEIRKLTKKNKKTTQYLIDQYLSDAKRRKVDKSLMSTLVSVANALAKSSPNVEIGTFQYSTGISAEELIYEFRRLKGFEGSGSNGKGVSGPFGGRQREIPLVERPGPSTAEESEDTLL